MADKNTADLGRDLLGYLYDKQKPDKVKEVESLAQTPLQSADITNEVSSVPEKLQPVDLAMPIRFAGKEYTRLGATDHFGDPRIAKAYDHSIVGSLWAQDNIYVNNPPIKVKAGDFSTPRYKIHAVFWGSEGLTQANMKWMTEGDYAVQMGLEPDQARIFPSTEMRVLNRDQIIDLTSQGYGVLGRLTQTDNLVWLVGQRASNLNGRNIQNGIERLTVDSAEPNLWNDRRWLEDDSLTASIADAYIEIIGAKRVAMSKPDIQNPGQSVLIAQALSQMTASKTGKLIYWCTERDILDFAKFHLTFIDGVHPKYPSQNEVVISPTTSKITDTNRSIVEAIRTSFNKPLPEALDSWKYSG